MPKMLAMGSGQGKVIVPACGAALVGRGETIGGKSTWADPFQGSAPGGVTFGGGCNIMLGMNIARSANDEPKPGQWLEANDFANVVRLTPLVSIDILVRSPDGRVLVGRRKYEPARDTFFLVGGRITKNESRAAAFQRLTREELGVEKGLEEARFLGVSDHFYPANRFEQPGFGTHYVVLGYELVLALMPATLPLEQHGEYAWMTEPELLASTAVHENTKAYFRASMSVD